MARDATIQVRIITTRETMSDGSYKKAEPDMPTDLAAAWRREAARVLGPYSSETEPKGRALSLLNCATDLEAALKAQAEAIKATAAPLKKVTAKPKPKRKR